MDKNSNKKRQERIKQSKEEKKKNEQKKEEQSRETYIGNNNSSQVTTEEDDKNDATAPLVDIGKKEQTPVQPAEHVPQYGLGNTSVQPDNSDTPVIVEKGPVLGAANGEDGSAHEGNDRQDTQPKSSSAAVPLVGNKKLEHNGIPTNSKQSTNPNNGSQNIKSSKLPVIAASALAIAGIISGVAVAVYLEMLAAGIAVGVCCLVAALIIYCCNRPSNSLEGSNVEPVANGELTVS